MSPCRAGRSRSSFHGLLWPLAAAICLCPLVACGGGGDAAGDAAAKVPSVAPGAWVVIGSSTAAGAGATPGNSWAVRLLAAYAERPVQLINLAVGGSTTYAGLPTQSVSVPGRPAPDTAANVDAALAQGAKLMLVSYPSNDTALGYSVEETVNNLLAIRDAARSHDVAAMILSTQPRALSASQLALLPQIDARLSASVGPCFVAVREVLAGPDGKLDPRYDSGDGVHPNDAGHALIYERVRAVVDSKRCVEAVSQ